MPVNIEAGIRRVRTLSAFTLLIRHRFAVQGVLDSLAWGLGLLVATVARFDFQVTEVHVLGVLALMPIAALAQIVAGLLFGLYIGRWRFGSFEEVLALARAAVLATALVFVADLWISEPRLVPVSAVVVGGIAALVIMSAVRYAWRLLLESRRRPDGDSATRLLVFGAGEAGAQVISGMLRDPQSPYIPVALIDDDPGKRNLRILGVPVMGTKASLAATAARVEAEGVLIAIPSAGAELVSEVTAIGTAAGLSVKVLPTVGELIGGDIGVGDIRDVTEADLLGRHEIKTDLASIAQYLTGKRVLVTGAGGSIGSELCKQVYRYAPAELVMLDRDESALHAVQLAIEGRALLDTPNLVLCDIRDGEAIERIFRQRKPDVVFHAAALKHVTMLERHPDEAVKTNVWGTLNVLMAAGAAGVGRFVNISTDKAADPCSVLGYSKRVTERLTSYVASTTEGTYLSVRFGNVLGSRGSMLGTFHSQIEAGGPVTVTDRDVTRYFMTVQEAVELVIQAAAIGRDGEALVLDMGTPVRIDDVARYLVERAARPVKIVYTGLRPGEKLHEVLLGADEPDERPVHPQISHVPVPPLEPQHVLAIDVNHDAVEIELAELASGYVVAPSYDFD